MPQADDETNYFACINSLSTQLNREIEFDDKEEKEQKVCVSPQLK